MIKEQEVWKPVPGFECYEASSFGEIRRKRTNHRIKFLQFSKQPTGYLVVTLSCCGNRKVQNVHRWIAQTFLPNPNNLPEVDHINNIRDDNKVSNLRWVDRSTNIRKSKEKGENF